MQEGSSPSDQWIRDQINRIQVSNATHRVDARASCNASESALKERFSSFSAGYADRLRQRSSPAHRPQDVLDSITLAVPWQIPAICKERSHSFT